MVMKTLLSADHITYRNYGRRSSRPCFRPYVCFERKHNSSDAVDLCFRAITTSSVPFSLESLTIQNPSTHGI